MNKNEATNKAQKLKATIEKAQRELKELEEVINKPESALWKPKLGETYYYNDGIIVDLYRWLGDTLDLWNYYNNSCFQTVEEAQKKSDALNALTRVRKYIIDNGLYSTEGKYVIGMRDTLRLITLKIFNTYGDRLGVFDTEEHARQVINNCEADIRTVLSYKGYL